MAATVNMVIELDAGTGRHIVHEEFKGPGRPQLKKSDKITWRNDVSTKDPITIVFPDWAANIFEPAARVEEIKHNHKITRTVLPTANPDIVPYLGFNSVTLDPVHGNSDPDIEIK